jgi:hypothetical protein
MALLKAFLSLALLFGFAASDLQYEILTTWDNQTISDPFNPARITIRNNGDEDQIRINIAANFWNSPALPPYIEAQGCPGRSGKLISEMWKYLHLFESFSKM